jgi:hypothetical protein
VVSASIAPPKETAPTQQNWMAQKIQELTGSSGQTSEATVVRKGNFFADIG